MQSVSSATEILSNGLGTTGIGIGVFLNALGVPGLSEILLPLGGAAVRQGKYGLGSLLLSALLGQVLGLIISYLIGRYGGVVVIEKYGKYVMLSRKELSRSQLAFERYGSRLVFIGSFTPGLQGAMGYAAGLAKMRFDRFVVAAILGKMVWVGVLVYLGMLLANNLALIDRSIKQIGVVILAAVIIAIIWHMRAKRNIREQ